jgi:uncharacterized protein (TIGR02611 family)
VSDESRELDAERHPTIQKLHERRQRHQDRHKLVRAGAVVLGALITLVGIVMTGPVPGPGFLVIPVGLALLALEFTWAERLLERAVVWADNAKEQAANRSKGEKIASGVAVAVGIAAFVTAAILWDIPVLPV